MHHTNRMSLFERHSQPPPLGANHTIFLVLILVLAISPLADAQPSEDGENAGLILHEHFDATSARLPGSAPDTAPDSTRPKVVHEGVELPAPTTEVRPGPEEPILDQSGARLDPDQPPLSRGNGPTAGSSQRFALDDDTDKEGVLQYYTVFNPSVVPFKRAGVFDAITLTRDGEYVLSVGDTRLRPLSIIGDDPQPDRDRFWGSLVLDAVRDRAIPIPSVAPGARILSVNTTPPVEAAFFVDGADNMFVKLDANGPVRLNFLTDARSDYFSPPTVPDGVTVRQAPSYSRGPRLPRGKARSSARRITRTIGLDKDAHFGPTLANLVGYYRNFDATSLAPEESTGDRLLDIALAQRGVCRHRAFAFVATASYMGIHARYVYNEAHAFVEVFVPLRGWARVDLGGGAEGLQVHNGDEKIRHAPRGADPFPQPEGFENGYSRASTANAEDAASGFEEVEGLPPHPSEIIEDPPATENDDGSSERGHASIPKDGVRGEALEGEAIEAPDELLASMPPDERAPSESGTKTEPLGPGEPRSSNRLETRITVTHNTPQVLRGESLVFGGRLFANLTNTALADREMIIYLEPVRGTPGARTTLTTVSTDNNGSFHMKVEIPPTLPQGHWDLYGYYPGDTAHAPCRSE